MPDTAVFLIDESVDYRLVKIIKDFGFRVFEIDTDKKGQSDTAVINDANLIDAIIITEDKDFGELTYRLKIKNKGIVLLRLSGLPFLKKVLIIKEAFSLHANDFKHAFSVISKSDIRIKSLKI